MNDLLPFDEFSERAARHIDILGSLKVEMAVHLCSQGRLSIGKARELAETPLWEFRQLLASRHISPHYGEADLEQDAVTLREMEQR